MRSDFPTINPLYVGRPFRFVYCSLLDYQEPNHAPFLFGCYKFDLHTGRFREQIWGKGCLGGETLFVPRQKARSEDDGYLLVLVNNVPLRRTELRMYDALTLGNPNCLVATIACPRRIVPLGTHGLWVSEDEVLNHGKIERRGPISRL